MESRKIINITTIVCIIFLICIVFILVYFYTPTHTLEVPPSYYLRFNQTKDEDSYELTIRAITPHQIETSKVGWRILDRDGITIFYNKFPTKSGEDNGISDKNITIVWFDHDQDAQLSYNDTIRIYTNGEDLSGYELRMGMPGDDWNCMICKIELS